MGYEYSSFIFPIDEVVMFRRLKQQSTVDDQ